MKKILLFLLMLFPIMLMASGGDPIQIDFTSIASVTLLTLAIVEFLKVIPFVLKYPQYIAWLIAIGLSYIGWALQLGMYVNLLWYEVLYYGVGIGLVSNGIFDAQFVQAIINALRKI
jgi:hypothetical protein